MESQGRFVDSSGWVARSKHTRCVTHLDNTHIDKARQRYSTLRWYSSSHGLPILWSCGWQLHTCIYIQVCSCMGFFPCYFLFGCNRLGDECMLLYTRK